MIYSISETTLKLGSRDYNVTKLQRLLSQKIGPIAITGCFDYETEIAVKVFQSRMLLRPDGVVGFLTWQALYTDAPVNMPSLRQGSHGSAVASIQELLAIDLYYRGVTDVKFGLKTHQSVKRFLLDYYLPTVGLVDGRTWRALSEI